MRILVFFMLVVFSTFSQETGWADEIVPPGEWTRYTPVRLEADLSKLSDNDKKMLPLLIDAARSMDKAFFYQAFGEVDPKWKELSPAVQRHLEVNYGPWERLQENQPFLPGVGAKPLGANFYPLDMTKAEFEQRVEVAPELKSLYTFVRRDDDGVLKAIPYSKQFSKEFGFAAQQLRAAAALAEDQGLQSYLLARADALESNEYQESDFLWMDMKTNAIDIVIGPIETYEDQLFGYKAACESYVLIKDLAWSERLRKYAAMLPALQRGLPVEDRYKQEEPGTNSDLNAYDVVYYAGDCNAGSKTIAINLPNDEEVQLQKGSRRLQLKNAMRAKFDKILVPIADLLIVPEQQKHITFNAFFSNTMFHEVAHGLGIKNTITGNGPVREALRENASALEEGKADILGLYMVTSLWEEGELEEGALEDYYVTFMAGIFRSVRFGASSAHGKANMIRFNFFEEREAFVREKSGHYRVDMDKMKMAVAELSAVLLKLQGEGDYEAARKFVEEMAYVGVLLESDLNRVNQRGIPTDIVFEQGAEVLGLQ